MSITTFWYQMARQSSVCRWCQSEMPFQPEWSRPLRSSPPDYFVSPFVQFSQRGGPLSSQVHVQHPTSNSRSPNNPSLSLAAQTPKRYIRTRAILDVSSAVFTQFEYRIPWSLIQCAFRIQTRLLWVFWVAKHVFLIYDTIKSGFLNYIRNTRLFLSKNISYRSTLRNSLFVDSVWFFCSVFHCWDHYYYIYKLLLGLTITNEKQV